jgi:tight adherence protein B
MRRARLLAGLALVSAVTFAGLSPASAADEALTVLSTDLTAYPDVRMVVAGPAQLADQALTTPAVTVTELGQSRTAQAELLTTDQLEVALVIDASGSMVGPALASAKAAARSFLTQLPRTVPVSVIGFGASPALVSRRSTDRAAQASAVDALQAKGETALYDALGLALTQFSPTGSRPVVVLVTDGADTASAAKLDATAAALAAAKVAVFAVELRTAESSPAALARLTAASGGRVVAAADPNALAAAFDSVSKQVVRQYAITYRSQATGPTDVDVTLEAKGVRATAHQRLELPSTPAKTAASPATTPAAEPAASSSAMGAWALIAGGVLWGIVILGLLMHYFLSRTPRARGFAAPRRGVSRDQVTDRAESLGDTLLRRQGGVAALSNALELAGLEIRPGELILGAAGASVLLLAVGWLVLAPLVGLALALMVPIVVRALLRAKAALRRKKFTDQLGETLQILSGSLRAGHGLAQSIDTVAREAESPTGEEFRRLTVEARLGRDFVDALNSLADRVGSEDFHWVVQAVEIQREVGGDLAAILDTVATTVRDRTRVRRQVSALSAEGRMSAWVLMVLPFGLGAIMAVTNRGYLSPLFSSGTGLRLVAVGAVLLTIGGLWLRQIVKPTF